MPTTMPVLRPDRRGYALGDEVFEGFDDRDDLTDAQRERLRRWKTRFGTDADQETVRDLTGSSDPEADQLSQGLVEDRQELQELHLSGLLDELEDQQRTWLAHPGTHPELSQVRYPLSTGALAVLTGATEDQVRRWADLRLVPAFRVGVERRFGRGAAARAMLLASSSKQEKAVLGAVAEGQGRRVILLLGALLGDAQRRDGLEDDVRGRLAAELRAAADKLEPQSPETKKRTPADRRRERAARRQAKAAPAGSTLHVQPAADGWRVIAARGTELAVTATQREALEQARHKLRSGGGGVVQVHGRDAVRTYRVAAKRTAPRTRRAAGSA